MSVVYLAEHLQGVIDPTLTNIFWKFERVGGEAGVCSRVYKISSQLLDIWWHAGIFSCTSLSFSSHFQVWSGLTCFLQRSRLFFGNTA